MKLIVVAVVTIFVTALVVLASTHRGVASEQSGSQVTLGQPLGPPHLNAAKVIQIIKTQGNTAPLFAHASHVATSFGSRTPTIRFNGQALPTKDYWTVTLTGLVTDSNGQPLLQRHGSPFAPAPPPVTSVTFIVDDLTGRVVEIDY